MKLVGISLALIGALLGVFQETPVKRPGVTLVRIEGALDVGTLSLVRRATEEALQRGDRLVFELDTPGGEVELMWKISRAIGNAADRGLVTVAWVNDRALSAGALIAMSCEQLYMRGRATIGSATAITVGPGGVMPVAEDEAVREKFTSSFRSEFRAQAEERGRSGAIAEAMVDAGIEVTQVRIDGEIMLLTGKERADRLERGELVQLVKTVVTEGELLNLTGTEALAIEFIDGLAESLDDVLERIGCAGVEPSVLARARSEDVAALLDRLAPLLFVGGLVLAFIELKMPGFGLPGISSIACFAALLFGRYLVGLADVPHFVIVAVGVVLVAVEIFAMPGALWPGITGGLLVLGGLLWASLPPGVIDQPYGRELAVDTAFQTMVWALLAAVVMWLSSRILPRTSAFDRMALDPGAAALPGEALRTPSAQPASGVVRGAQGTAVTALRPVGKVSLDGVARQFEARYPSGALDVGERVRVVEVEGSGRLVVEPVEGATR